MSANGKLYHDQSPLRYFNNAKETLAKSPVQYGHYLDVKYVSEAAGMAYLAARKAILNYAKQKGITLKPVPKTYEGMSHLIQKLPQRNKLHYKFKDVYDLLHSGAYYDGLTRVTAIKDGFKEAEDIIRMLN